MAERVDVIVVGGGQTGLVTGHQLAEAGISYVILDAGSRVGQSWRERWDSLELFTVAQYCSLPGLPFPGKPGHFPGKDEMADYLQRYARTFNLRIQLETRVDEIEPVPGGYRLTTTRGQYEAGHVIVATGAYLREY